MLAFRISWQGALLIFLGFNYAVGIDILSKAYLSLHGNVTSRAKGSAKAEGSGHILNYFIHLAIVTVWGACLAGWDERRLRDMQVHLQPGSSAGSINLGMMIFVFSILVWRKFFSDTPPVRQFCIRLMDRLFQ